MPPNTRALGGCGPVVSGRRTSRLLASPNGSWQVSRRSGSAFIRWSTNPCRDRLQHQGTSRAPSGRRPDWGWWSSPRFCPQGREAWRPSCPRRILQRRRRWRCGSPEELEAQRAGLVRAHHQLEPVPVEEVEQLVAAEVGGVALFVRRPLHDRALRSDPPTGGRWVGRPPSRSLAAGRSLSRWGRSRARCRRGSRTRAGGQATSRTPSGTCSRARGFTSVCLHNARERARTMTPYSRTKNQGWREVRGALRQYIFKLQRLKKNCWKSYLNANKMKLQRKNETIINIVKFF